MTGNNRTQYLGNDLLVFCHHKFDHTVFAGDHITQGAAVDVQETPQQSGGAPVKGVQYAGKNAQRRHWKTKAAVKPDLHRGRLYVPVHS